MAVNSTVQPSKWNFLKPPLFPLLVHLFVDPLEDQELDAIDPALSPALVHAHARARPHQPTLDAEAQGTLLALVIVIVTLTAAGRTVVVVHLDATFTDQIVLGLVLARLFAAVI